MSAAVVAWCDEHGMTRPCTGCAADHLTGDHAQRHVGTCSRCEPVTPARAPRRRRRRPVVDVAALAAHDDTVAY